ncbi:hypothetical protein ACQP00_34960 [Dactylosporangium sp. CS-047395]|uniref:hypothetical protein n=1 Tax=Dactylosporangium sp. CS-047395 TaxID=3239936 RepID=UPI003D8D859E
MSDIQQLRRTLVEHEDLAPYGAGLIEAAQAGAARVRRRRRVGYTAAVALATAAVLGGAPTLIGGPSAPVGASAAPHYRDAMQATLGIADGSGYKAFFHGVVGSTQYAVARPVADPNQFGGTVLVHDPGTYDGRRLLAGARVTVHGHPAYFVADLGLATGASDAGPPVSWPKTTPQPVPAVGWQDASGVWVVVYADGPLSDPRSTLLRVAAAVTLGPPADVRVPFQLGYVPAGLRPTLAELDHYDTQAALVGLGGRPSWDSLWPPSGVNTKFPVGIQVLPRSDYVDYPEAGRPPTTQIAGHDVWYYTDPRTAGRVFLAQGSNMVVHFGQCYMSIFVADRAQVPYPELTRMVTDMRFADCHDPATWLPPVG